MIARRPGMHIGLGLARADGPAKVTGAALYVDDVRPEGCLYGATVRSPIAHGKLLGLRRDPGFDWSGVTVCTADDIPGENVVALMTDDQPVLARGVIRHVAEPVALVAAPSRDRALAAARHIEVLCEPWPALFAPEESEGNAIRIFGEDNLFHRISMEHGDGLDALAAAEAAGAVIVEGTYRVGLQEQLYIEPQGMIAVPREDGGLTIFGSMQCPYYIVKALKRVLGHGRLNVVQAVTGGGFGGKEEYPSMVAAHAAVLALATKRPVKLIYRRDEDLRATTKRHPAVMRYATAVDPGTGKLLAADVDLLFDGGAYNTLSPVVLSRAILHSLGPYVVPHARLDARMVATHTPPNGAFRGFGAPQVMFAAERHMDRIARTLGFDPIALRRLNLYRDGAVTPSGQVLSQVAAAEVLDRALAAAEAPLSASFVPVRPGGGQAAARRRSGRGVAIAWHGCGFTGNGEAALRGEADVSLDGDRVLIHTASTDIGQGTDTIFLAIVADALGIDVSRVAMAPHDTADVPDSGPTVASRTAMVVGGVVKKAAGKLLDALRAEVGPGGEALSFDALCAKRVSGAALRVRAVYEDAGAAWDPVKYQGDAYPTYGWSCVVVDVEVDEDTGEVLYRRLVQATDVGRALNPVLAAGQLEGGALQGLGYATCEEVVLDAEGGMRNNRLTNYIIPTALDAPEMVTILVENPFAGGPFGAKGIGEIPHDVPAPAVAQAIEAATGAVLDRLPMTPEVVLAALCEREEACA
ncbi:MAG: xanthine dehydrogenase family protein [Myxococcales bacterium]|nr:xanthine dehydrogenase family protein [Myxococcales bacterium]